MNSRLDPTVRLQDHLVADLHRGVALFTSHPLDEKLFGEIDLGERLRRGERDPPPGGGADFTLVTDCLQNRGGKRLVGERVVDDTDSAAGPNPRHGAGMESAERIVADRLKTGRHRYAVGLLDPIHGGDLETRDEKTEVAVG